MHELSIVLSLLDVAAEEAARHEGERVVALHVKIGPYSGVVKEALISAFELAREGSPLADSSLLIEEVPLEVWCSRCSAAVRPTIDSGCCCPVCGEPSGEILHGRELELVALELGS
jgi:hydrogenase nickel incorporation protein HypA/HybF